ncbi:MAG: MarR family winged helix-turn-helix transcriptional regulator [Chloroflexota bacterium]
MPTHYQGTVAEIRALDAYIKLQRAADSVMVRTNRHLSGHNLSVSQFAVLEALYHLGPLNQSELGRKLLKSPANITTVLQNLEKRGLLRRARSQADQRVIEVTITTAGADLIARIMPDHIAGIVDDMGVLSAEEQQTLSHLCRKLGLGTGT